MPPQRKSRQKKGLGSSLNSAQSLSAVRRNQIWSYDFVSHRTEDGGALRILNVVDEHTRVCVGSHVARSIGAGEVKERLAAMFKAHGKPELIRSDNGREFTAELLCDWLSAEGVGQLFIDRGSPQQNPYVERFNGTMRDEVLNGELFGSVLEARVVIARFVTEYNELRPHRGLGMLTPMAFSERTRVGSE